MQHNPIFCILPPDMLKHISEKGSDQQREMALNTLHVSEQFRAQRQGLAAIPSISVSAGPVLKTLTARFITPSLVQNCQGLW